MQSRYLTYTPVINKSVQIQNKVLGFYITDFFKKTAGCVSESI